jgi:uncharacterized membrane protein YqjE
VDPGPSAQRGEQSAAPPSPSLQEAAARLTTRALELVGTRVELAGVEMAAARERLLASLLLAAALFACVLLALMAASFGVIAYFWDTARFTAIIVVTLVFATLGWLAWTRLATLRATAPAPFAATLDALRTDAQRLRGTPAP